MQRNHHALAARRRGARVPRRQDGMALLIALMVLVVVSILGAVAMRSALFQNRVSINSQTNNLAFQAAESGIDAAQLYANSQMLNGIPVSNMNNLFNLAINSHGQRLCFTAANDQSYTVPGATSTSTITGHITIDTNTTLQPDGSTTYTVPCPTLPNSNITVTTVVGPAPNASNTALQGYDLKYGGSLILIETRSYAEVPNTNVKAVHAQQWGVIGPSDSEGG